MLATQGARQDVASVALLSKLDIGGKDTCASRDVLAKLKGTSQALAAVYQSSPQEAALGADIAQDLPDCLLLKIFEAVAARDESLDSIAFGVTRVCSRWRRLGFTLSSWTSLRFRRPLRLRLLLHFVDLAHPPQGHVLHMDLQHVVADRTLSAADDWSILAKKAPSLESLQVASSNLASASILRAVPWVRELTVLHSEASLGRDLLAAMNELSGLNVLRLLLHGRRCILYPDELAILSTDLGSRPSADADRLDSPNEEPEGNKRMLAACLSGLRELMIRAPASNHVPIDDLRMAFSSLRKLHLQFFRTRCPLEILHHWPAIQRFCVLEHFTIEGVDLPDLAQTAVDPTPSPKKRSRGAAAVAHVPVAPAWHPPLPPAGPGQPPVPVPAGLYPYLANLANLYFWDWSLRVLHVINCRVQAAVTVTNMPALELARFDDVLCTKFLFQNCPRLMSLVVRPHAISAAPPKIIIAHCPLLSPPYICQ